MPSGGVWRAGGDQGQGHGAENGPERPPGTRGGQKRAREQGRRTKPGQEPRIRGPAPGGATAARQTKPSGSGPPAEEPGRADERPRPIDSAAATNPGTRPRGRARRRCAAPRPPRPRRAGGSIGHQARAACGGRARKDEARGGETRTRQERRQQAPRAGEQRNRTGRKGEPGAPFRKSRVSRKGALARPLSCLQLCAKRRFCETEPFLPKK